MARVAIDPAVTDAYSDMKLRKTNSFLVYNMTDDAATVILEQKADAYPDLGFAWSDGDAYPEYDQLFKVFMDASDAKTCRFASFDFRFMHKGEKRNKMIFIYWAPESAGFKAKMNYSNCLSYLKDALHYEIEIQGVTPDEISLQAIYEKCSKNME